MISFESYSLEANPVDLIVAAIYTMIAAESLGLGICMLGAVHPLIQYEKGAQSLVISTTSATKVEKDYL